MLFDMENLTLSALVAIFVFSTVVILFSGTRIAWVAEGIATKTGLGQAIVGAVFLGISTSLAGTVLSFYAAADNHPDLAISNAIGGIAAQTFFLAIADLTYRKANLEHAASSLENLMQSALLVVLLSIPIVAMSSFDITFFGVHPASLLLILLYVAGINWVRRTQKDPLWKAKDTEQTHKENHGTTAMDIPFSLKRLLVEFSGLSVVIGVVGIVLAKTSISLAMRTGISETVIGGFLTSVVTSLPELVTTLAAVRRGALNLAVGDIIGGNSFDVLFLAGSDVFYRAGSLYHAMTIDHILIIGVTIFMTGILMMGMLRRERFGPINIGGESFILILSYAFLILLIGFSG